MEKNSDSLRAIDTRIRLALEQTRDSLDRTSDMANTMVFVVMAIFLAFLVGFFLFIIYSKRKEGTEWKMILLQIKEGSFYHVLLTVILCVSMFLVYNHYVPIGQH